MKCFQAQVSYLCFCRSAKLMEQLEDPHGGPLVLLP